MYDIHAYRRRSWRFRWRVPMSTGRSCHLRMAERFGPHGVPFIRFLQRRDRDAASFRRIAPPHGIALIVVIAADELARFQPVKQGLGSQIIQVKPGHSLDRNIGTPLSGNHFVALHILTRYSDHIGVSNPLQVCWAIVMLAPAMTP